MYRKETTTMKLTEKDVAKVKQYMEMIAHHPAVKAMVVPDRGSCVLGNKITMSYYPPRCKHPRTATVAYNNWTQAEQYGALKKMIEMVKKEFPEYADAIKYDCGNID